MKKQISNSMMNDAAKSLKVQQRQRSAVDNQLSKIGDSLDTLSDINNQNADDIDALLTQAEMMVQEQGIDLNSFVL
ncbi:hypothetical protein, partial [Pseudomonas sp. 2995-1]|uniref:hypothetical protein n=1 Tax=Pseudomonas sp. 2995-1 TaxID=1712679 RepID=UPI000C58C2BE